MGMIWIRRRVKKKQHLNFYEELCEVLNSFGYK